MSELRLQQCSGDAVIPWLDELARLRITVFREWPYRYAGSVDYEAEYLRVFARSPRSLFVLAGAGDTLIGASTAIPLVDEAESFQQPFRARGMDPAEVFYFGESVLLPEHRGRGLGHRFFDAREAWAQTCGGFALTAFCAVDRDLDDPRRPSNARDLAPFWASRGYQRRPELVCSLDWPEIDRAGGSLTHQLTFWTRPLVGTLDATRNDV